MKTLNKILGPQMISNEKIVICKVVDIFKHYYFDLKFVFVQLNLKKL